jgi:hypothetical protein
MRRPLVTDFTAESATAEPYPLRVLATEMRSASVVQTPAALETAMGNYLLYQERADCSSIAAAGLRVPQPMARRPRITSPWYSTETSPEVVCT